MAEFILMTALSPTMEEGTIAGWTGKVGDTISSGDVLCEVETDKASMEYESTQEGVLLEILVSGGESAGVGTPIAIIGEKGEDYSSLLAGMKSKPGRAAPAPAEAQSAQKTDETPAAEPVETVAQPSVQPAAPVRDSFSTGDATETLSRVPASPLARKLAANRNIDLSLVTGSGPDGRVVKEDVDRFRGAPYPAAGTRETAAGTRGSGSQRADESVPVNGRRAVIAKRLAESKFSAPHYYLKTSVAMDVAISARQSLNAQRPDKVSLNAFFLKFAAEALKRHPGINASWQGDHIIQFGSIDIGLAVDLGNGLITPIVRDCGNRGVVSIDEELKDLIERAGSGKLRPEEYTGAGFTISNLGSFGVEEFTAIINPPGSAILALGKTTATPVVNTSGELAVAQVMKMTLSCDHRVIDGAAGGRFLEELRGLMENPARLLY